ncbi:hypothetical protein TWF730_003767 [Orbilia blumenaviensis]|uniref:Tyrosinase copper-binding domain-containing protein n=1 Tax=Orbilia blumenaviensis TaxID=1796055 RepID=A0AAV9U3Q6_9PEZI
MTACANQTNPVWEDEIKNFFAKPYWIKPEADREAVGKFWTKKMHSGDPKESYNFGINLSDHNSVTTWSRQIYLQIKSENMPMTDKRDRLFPKEAIDRFHLWITQGHRKTEADPIVDTPIKFPTYEPPPFIVRKDISSLSEDELNAYRAAIDDKLNPTDLGSKWQELCYIHTDWCLHYQEGFLPWHRAHLMYMESLIGCGIPYWNWMAEDASNPNSSSSGIPQAFFDEDYLHPTKGKRPNPLRFALAKDGASAKGQRCVTRAGELMPGAPLDKRDPYIKKMNDYQRQILAALREPLFSIPQGYLGTPGYPWANIPVFDPPQPEELYTHDFNGKPIGKHFDNLLEQPHDNFHGWIGDDMADNSYTAFDPVFWSFHANMDRVFETWIRSHPTAQYTSSFPLRPFVGAHSTRMVLSEGDPRAWIHTTIGDMAKDCKSLGYIFMPPRVPDLKESTKDQLSALGNTEAMVLLGQCDEATASNPQTSGRAGKKAYIVFDGVKCTDETFVIDVFLKDKSRAALAGMELESKIENPYFVGTSTRIGMGDGVSSESKGKRCILHGVQRFLPLNLIPVEVEHLSAEQIDVILKVTNVSQGVEVEKEVYQQMVGFTGKFYWDEPINPASQEISEIPDNIIKENKCYCN